MNKAKSFQISKHDVLEAYKKVKAARGGAGIDDQTMDDFEKDLKKNLYKIWNRMSSGCYLPPPVKRVAIPKKDGGERHLGIPTISDRVAQMVVKMQLEPIVEPKFHDRSFGYRPRKSAHQAIEQARWQCFFKDWVLDIDIKGFFDNIDHTWLMRMVEHHTKCKWTILYIKRWLKAPVQLEDGTLLERSKGTPQGGVISPLLANIFLHHVFDQWMQHKFHEQRFERYADDIIIHCRDRERAKKLKYLLERRLAKFGLELHPEKTRIVYCKDDKRTERHLNPTSFDFLGYTFRQRTAKDKTGQLFNGFLPAISKHAVQKISEEIRSWRLHRQVGIDINGLSKQFNPIIRGWYLYYGKFYQSAMDPIYWRLQQYLTRWAMMKYKHFRHRRKWAYDWVFKIANQDPKLFAHWASRR